MEKQKKWHFFLILTVLVLTIYNVLPTLFYYSKPLKNPIEQPQADQIADSISKRIKELESDSKDWLSSFCSLLNVKPQSITPSDQNFIVTFTKSEDAAKFRKYLPRAGAMISFPPAQLGLAPQEAHTKEVIVQKRISTSLTKDLFSFAPKGSQAYKNILIDRAAQIGAVLAGPSEPALSILFANQKNSETLETLALQIRHLSELAKTHPAVANRFAASFTQGPFADKPAVIKSLSSALDSAKEEMKKQQGTAAKQSLFIKATNYLKKNEKSFAQGSTPLELQEAQRLLQQTSKLDIGEHNPIFSQVAIDWEKEQILLTLHKDVQDLDQELVNEAARVARHTNEVLNLQDGKYIISFHQLPESSSMLVLDLGEISKKEASSVLQLLKNEWTPTHPDLQNIAIADLETYLNLSAEEKALSLVVQSGKQIRIIPYGIDRIAQNYEQFPDSELALSFQSDLQKLAILLAQKGFQVYRGPDGNLVFEKSDLYGSLLAASRENFQVKGTGRYAYLELSTVEQRLLTENKIDTKIHEDLIKWQDEYNAAQVNLHGTRFDVPKPTKNIFLSNFILSFKKLLRGDERKVIHWGLDLSGGKTVQVELLDSNHQVVKNEEDIKHGMNELYSRVNKMGVSEVAIRQLGNHIVLDFPGSQSLSATDLIKASSMYFHVVNEKFSSPYSPLSSLTNRFLMEVWNEAVVKNRLSAENINEIAWQHLYGNNPTETAKALLENGLALQSPENPSMGSSPEDGICKIAVLRGDHWFGQNHPLLIVFKNYALEGSQLEQIQPGYDPQKGNYLSFGIQNSTTTPDGKKVSPRDILHSWSSRYSKESMTTSNLSEFTKGHGWRMAVVLNDTVISAPTLDGSLRDNASISGSFSQREINQLATDLKAGSLTYTPHILSEKNVSPDLGQKERFQGILATLLSLCLIIASMIVYYRFAGFVASVAVILNLLILWATLQNIGATLSLAGIAGIILTVGMAIDANVLVFERIKEEFANSGRIASAISAGYEKAYAAIIDSNVTTIIAALILLNFDSGPIKGFAVTLIIGIASSMFTALFMTRYYFAGWVQNPKNTALKMANFIQATAIDFLKHAKAAFAISAAIILIGCSLVYAKKATIFGMDFTGGFSIHLTVQPTEEENYAASVEKALLNAGAAKSDFQIRELSPKNSLRILFSHSMELAGKPFYDMPFANDKKQVRYPFETNPRISWIVDALQTQNIALTQESLSQLEKEWTSTSGQMSDAMKNNAIIGLLIAFVCIFIYIAFRFEYKFAAASVICLLHDVFITLGTLGILHQLGVPVQIDLNTVAAIMTIVGYSLNDTIIIFDRIREETRLSPNRSLTKIVNESLNSTLSRTTITSGTTLLVLIALVALGGSSIFSFALVMTIGVFFGTLSSWYIAAPLMLIFHKRETKNVVVEHIS
jgi:SecD/SecF fusion protein